MANRIIRGFSRLGIAAAVLVATGAIDISGPAAADDPNAIFYSDAVLRSAITSISQMQEPELRAFTRYLAECGADGLDDVSKHFCSVALASYEIEFGEPDSRTRDLDRWIYARSRRGAWETTHPQARDVTQIVAEAKKYALVVTAISDAARERFRALRQPARRPQPVQTTPALWPADRVRGGAN